VVAVIDGKVRVTDISIRQSRSVLCYSKKISVSVPTKEPSLGLLEPTRSVASPLYPEYSSVAAKRPHAVVQSLARTVLEEITP
jgi:hypothetical protein